MVICVVNDLFIFESKTNLSLIFFSVSPYQLKFLMV